jgi:glutamine amidotransferase
MHNGAASNFIDIKRAVINEMSHDAYANVFGATDSESVEQKNIITFRR